MARSHSAARAMQIAEEAEAHFDTVAKTGKPALFMPNLGGPVVRAENALVDLNNVEFKYNSVEEAFPPVAPGAEPLGSMILVQLRQPAATTRGGLVLDGDTRKTELDNTQVAKVIALGPLAFHHRDTYKEWPEGAWCEPGDFVRIPKYMGDRWAVQFRRADGADDLAIFIILKDLALLGKYATAEAALAAKAFL